MAATGMSSGGKGAVLFVSARLELAAALGTPGPEFRLVPDANALLCSMLLSRFHGQTSTMATVSRRIPPTAAFL
ncbi:hypothetical protein CSC74_07005 [Pseudoxanthomonas yeongjuensis]|nr:hypothetical protein CSC74_07005 [Pseudoxanthomonas yeongjuensis]